jgi:hypothetical protein
MGRPLEMQRPYVVSGISPQYATTGYPEDPSAYLPTTALSASGIPMHLVPSHPMPSHYAAHPYSGMDYMSQMRAPEMYGYSAPMLGGVPVMSPGMSMGGVHTMPSGATIAPALPGRTMEGDGGYAMAQPTYMSADGMQPQYMYGNAMVDPSMGRSLPPPGQFVVGAIITPQGMVTVIVDSEGNMTPYNLPAQMAPAQAMYETPALPPTPAPAPAPAAPALAPAPASAQKVPRANKPVATKPTANPPVVSPASAPAPAPAPAHVAPAAVHAPAPVAPAVAPVVAPHASSPAPASHTSATNASSTAGAPSSPAAQSRTPGGKGSGKEARADKGTPDKRTTDKHTGDKHTDKHTNDKQAKSTPTTPAGPSTDGYAKWAVGAPESPAKPVSSSPAPAPAADVPATATTPQSKKQDRTAPVKAPAVPAPASPVTASAAPVDAASSGKKPANVVVTISNTSADSTRTITRATKAAPPTALNTSVTAAAPPASPVTALPASKTAVKKDTIPVISSPLAVKPVLTSPVAAAAATTTKADSPRKVVQSSPHLKVDFSTPREFIITNTSTIEAAAVLAPPSAGLPSNRSSERTPASTPGGVVYEIKGSAAGTTSVGTSTPSFKHAPAFKPESHTSGSKPKQASKAAPAHSPAHASPAKIESPAKASGYVIAGPAAVSSPPTTDPATQPKAHKTKMFENAIAAVKKQPTVVPEAKAPIAEAASPDKARVATASPEKSKPVPAALPEKSKAVAASSEKSKPVAATAEKPKAAAVTPEKPHPRTPGAVGVVYTVAGTPESKPDATAPVVHSVLLDAISPSKTGKAKPPRSDAKGAKPVVVAAPVSAERSSSVISTSSQISLSSTGTRVLRL